MASSNSSERGDNFTQNQNTFENSLQNEDCTCVWNRGKKLMLLAADDPQIHTVFWKLYNDSNTRVLEYDRNTPEELLYNLKTIDLNGIIMYMGLAPTYGFEFVCGFRGKNKLACRFLDEPQLRKLAEILVSIYEQAKNAFNSVKVHDAKEYIDYEIDRLIDEGIDYDLEMILNQFASSESEALIHFRHSWRFIEKYMDLQVAEKEQCEKMFVNALFAQNEERKVRDPGHLEYAAREFFMHAINLNCNCMPNKGFLITLALEFDDWFFSCALVLENLLHDLKSQEDRKNKNERSKRLIKTKSCHCENFP